jgi:hypothetical protein
VGFDRYSLYLSFGLLICWSNCCEVLICVAIALEVDRSNTWSAVEQDLIEILEDGDLKSVGAYAGVRAIACGCYDGD